MKILQLVHRKEPVDDKKMMEDWIGQRKWRTRGLSSNVQKRLIIEIVMHRYGFLDCITSTSSLLSARSRKTSQSRPALDLLHLHSLSISRISCSSPLSHLLSFSLSSRWIHTYEDSPSCSRRRTNKYTTWTTTSPTPFTRILTLLKIHFLAQRPQTTPSARWTDEPLCLPNVFLSSSSPIRAK